MLILHVVKKMLKSPFYHVLLVFLITTFSHNVFAQPQVYRCAASVIRLYDQLVRKSLPIFSAQYEETIALFNSLGLSNLLEDIKVIYTIHLKEQQPNPVSLIDVYIKKTNNILWELKV